MDPNSRYPDLLQLLQISPHDHSTCIGQAKSTGQQCRCRVAKASRTHASRLLQDLSSRPQTIEDTKYKMELIASLLLCKTFHQDQKTSIGISWTDKMRGSDFIIPVSLPSPTLGNHHRVMRATRNQSLQAAEAGSPQQRSEGEATRSRRRRGPVTPLSMTLRSQTARSSTSHEV